jgi:hypothetical protein
MAKRDRSGTKTDLSSFMCIVLMLTGALVTILITNIMIISANPENISVTTVIRAHGFVDGQLQGSASDLFPYGNRTKEPSYVDVHRDHLVIYPGEEVLSLADLESEGNAFEKLLKKVQPASDKEYIVLLVRPRSAIVARRLKKAIRDRGIDIGYELYEENRPVDYEQPEGGLKKG